MKKTGILRRFELFTLNGINKSGINPVEFARKVEALGAGEVVINAIDHDGVMKGYDINLIKSVRDSISLPMTVLGGAGSLEDIEGLITQFGIIGAAAGSLFVFKGKYRAVLINYPDRAAKDALIEKASNLV